MNDMPNEEPEQRELRARHEFLQSIGKWSLAAILAGVGGAWLGTAPEARAAGWINRRGVGGGWINGGGWVNRAGGWINGGGSGGGWINRRGAGARWVNRR